MGFIEYDHIKTVPEVGAAVRFCVLVPQVRLDGGIGAGKESLVNRCCFSAPRISTAVDFSHMLQGIHKVFLIIIGKRRPIIPLTKPTVFFDGGFFAVNLIDFGTSGGYQQDSLRREALHLSTLIRVGISSCKNIDEIVFTASYA